MHHVPTAERLRHAGPAADPLGLQRSLHSPLDRDRAFALGALGADGAEVSEGGGHAALVLLRLAHEQEGLDAGLQRAKVAAPLPVILACRRLRLPVEELLVDGVVLEPEVLLRDPAFIQGDEQQVVAAVADRLHAGVEVAVAEALHANAHY
jgi:hypothetical protein